MLRGDASLALFPILSTIFATLAMVSIWAPTLITRGVFDHQTVERNDPVVYAAGVAIGVSCRRSSRCSSTWRWPHARRARCAARTPRLREGLARGRRRIGPILGWTVVSTTFGLLLRAFENRVAAAGQGRGRNRRCRMGNRHVLRCAGDRARGHRTVEIPAALGGHHQGRAGVRAPPARRRSAS